MAMPSQRTSSPDKDRAIHAKRPTARMMAKRLSVTLCTAQRSAEILALPKAKPNKYPSGDNGPQQRDSDGKSLFHSGLRRSVRAIASRGFQGTYRAGAMGYRPETVGRPNVLRATGTRCAPAVERLRRSMERAS
jgi:hypothetical protein